MQLALLDEPVNLVDAMLIQRGLRPHVDFWTMYPALNYRLNAAAFGALGPSVVAERLVQAAIYVLLLAAWFLYLRRARRLSTGAATGWTLFAAVAIGASFTNYSFNGLAFSFAGLLLALVGLERGTRRPATWLAAAGVVVGIGALTKLNFGGYVGLAVGVTLVLDVLHAEHRAGWFRRCCAFAVPVVIVLGVYAFRYRDALALLWDDMIAFPGEHLEQHRILALALDPAGLAAAAAIAAPFVWIALRRSGVARLVAAGLALLIGAGTLAVGITSPSALPRIFIVAAAALVAWQCTRARLGRPEFVVWLAFTLFGHYFLSRADRFHYHAMVPFVALLGPFVFDRGLALRRAERVLAVALVAFLTLPVGAWDQRWLVRRAPALVTDELSALRRGASELLSRGDTAVLMAPGPDANPLAARLFRDADEIAAVRYVHERTAADDPIYVGLRDHADVFMCPTRTYWIAGRRPGVRRHMLEPGMTTEPAIQREMIAELERNRVRWVILRENLEGDPSYEARAYRGADRLDAHIRTHFREAVSYGAWTVRRRVGD